MAKIVPACAHTFSRPRLIFEMMFGGPDWPLHSLLKKVAWYHPIEFTCSVKLLWLLVGFQGRFQGIYHFLIYLF